MAHSLSSKKRIRQNEKRRMLNRARKSALKSQLRGCGEQLQKGTPEAAETEFRKAVKAIDQAASRRTLHPNAAARRKSQLARRLNALKAKQAGGTGA